MDTNNEFQSRVVLVTGGTKGIGKGIAQAFLKAGAQVVVCGRQQPEEAVSYEGRSADFIACDVREAQAVKDMITEVHARHGRLDVLINNAGGAPAVDAATAQAFFTSLRVWRLPGSPEPGPKAR